MALRRTRQAWELVLSIDRMTRPTPALESMLQLSTRFFRFIDRGAPDELRQAGVAALVAGVA